MADRQANHYIVANAFVRSVYMYELYPPGISFYRLGSVRTCSDSAVAEL